MESTLLKFEVMPLGAYQTNCYFLWAEGSDTCVVIDPGYEPETVLLKAKSLGKSIEAILLTHGHFDHVGAVADVAAQTDCKVFLCTEDLSVPHRFTAGPLYYTDAFADGHVLHLAGLELQILHTPGHTPGSVCILCEDCMFSGDTLFQDSCGRTDLPGGSFSQIRQSLQRLRAIEKDYAVYPGHGPATTLAEEKNCNPYMR